MDSWMDDIVHHFHSGSLNTGLGLLVAKLFCGLSGALKLSGVSETAGSCLHSIVGGLGHVQ